MTIYSSPLQIPSLLLRCREPSSIPITRTLFRRNTCRPSSLGFPSLKTLKCLSQRQPQGPAQEFERLFSNLNQATLKREPGSLTSAILLVAGTTVGAGILAIPAVTEEAGFLASAVTCILCWIYMVVTGLLIAEVNVNTMCELGSGGVSLVSMAMRTLGKVGVQIACWSYLFIHYALLVAYVARSSDILTNFFHIPFNGRALLLVITYYRWEAAALFSLVFGAICYFGSQRFIGAINGLLVFGIIVSFTALVGLASGDLEWNSLLQAHFEAIPQSIPIIALAFVYQNVVPVLCTNLEGNLSKVSVETTKWSKQTYSISVNRVAAIDAILARPRHIFQGLGFCRDLWSFGIVWNPSCCNVLVREVPKCIPISKTPLTYSWWKVYSLPCDWRGSSGHFFSSFRKNFDPIKKILISQNLQKSSSRQLHATYYAMKRHI